VPALLAFLSYTAMAFAAPSAAPHQNFHLAVYIPVSIVEHMHEDPQ
jgi:hypothetical protein